MIDIMTLIQGRRSIRKFEDKPVPDECLAQILEAVRWSPSWANTQCWEVVVVQDAEVKKQLQASLPPKGNPAFNAIVQAPLVLVLCARANLSGYYKGEVTTKFGDWMLFDLGLATQNICLTAHSLGLGTVVVGLFDHLRAGEAVGLPAGYELVCLLPLGYPAKSGSAPNRKQVAEFMHRDRW